MLEVLVDQIQPAGAEGDTVLESDRLDLFGPTTARLQSPPSVESVGGGGVLSSAARSHPTKSHPATFSASTATPVNRMVNAAAENAPQRS